MKDTILSLSGGLDSSSLLFEFKDQIKLAVSFKYGSIQEKQEIKAAKRVTKKAGVDHIIVDLTKAFKGFSSALLNDPKDIPDATYDEDAIKKLVVPFRNGIFLSILAGLAESNGCSKIALASHNGDHAIYPDCRPEFSEKLADAIRLGTSNNVEFFRPYINISKNEIAKRGVAHGLNPDWTYSCYKGGKTHCGTCPTCVERAEALAHLND